MAKNDWLVASLNNPKFSASDMQDVLGLSIDNTQFLPKSVYENSPYIRETFKNNDGSFDQNSFNQAYYKALNDWNQFTSDEEIDSFEYSLFHTRATPTSKIRNPDFTFQAIPNPDKLTVGVINWNQIPGERKYTPSELAQQNKIFDSATGKYIDETPNDRALFNNPIKWFTNLFSDPLVLATYDEDTEEFDPFTGKTILHKKGEYKLNSDGTYYAETLNGRSVAGKQVISNTDLITVDGSTINKYDFFDSDSLDKSVIGTIFKTAATVAPLLIGGPVSTIYSGALIARELSKSLPMLYSMATSLFGNEDESEFLNTLAGYGEKFTGGISEYGSQHTFSFEQFGKLLADVATQWGQQQLIAKSVAKLRNSNGVMQRAYTNAKIEYDQQVGRMANAYKNGQLSQAEAAEISQILSRGGGDWTQNSFGKAALEKYLPKARTIVERNSRLGADAALAYMALVSNYDVYNNMLERGATHKDASIVALGSTIGMFSVDRFLHLGEMFFDDLQNQAQQTLRKYATEQATKYYDVFNSAIGKNAEKQISGPLFKRIGQNVKVRNTGEARLLSKAINFGRGVAEEFSNSAKGFKTGIVNHTLNASGKALGEGLEEVSEEFVSDISKQLYEWAGELGANTSIKDAGAWDNMLERYAMSFFGGAIGGYTFYGVGKFNEAKEKAKTTQAEDAEEELIYLLRQGKKDDLITELSKLHKQGKLGSTKLGINTETDDKKNTVYLSAEPGEKTQNDLVYNLISQQINALESYINNYGANLSDDDLFKQMVLGNERLLNLKDYLQGASYTAGYQNAFQETLKNAINAKITIDNQDSQLTDLQKRNKEKEENSGDLLSAIKEATKLKTTAEQNLAKYEEELKNFLNGKKSLEYARKTVFLADPILQSVWSFLTFDQWLSKKYDKTAENLSLAEKNKYQEEYFKDLKAKTDFRSDDIWKSFLQVEKEFTPFLTQLEQNSGEILKIKNTFKQISETLESINKEFQRGLLDLDDQLPGESDEAYKNRFKVDDNLTEEEKVKELEKRAEDRMKKVEKYNQDFFTNFNNLVESAQKVLEILNTEGTFIDPLTYRTIKQNYSGIIGNGAVYGNAGNLAVENNEEKLLEKFNEFAKKTISDRLDKLITIANNQLKETVILSPEEIDNLTVDIFVNPENLDDNLRNAFLTAGLDAEYDSRDDNDELKSEDELFVLLEQYKEKLRTVKLPVIDNVEGLEKIKEAINTAKTGQEIEEILKNVNDDVFYYINDVDAAANIATLNDASKKQLAELINDVKNFKYQLTTQPFDIKAYGRLSLEQISAAFDELKKQPKLINGELENQSQVDSVVDFFKNTIISDIENNPLVKLLSQINDKLNDSNPIKTILATIGKHNIDNVDLDTLLDKIEDRLYDLDSIEDFELSDYEENQLRYFQHLLNIANGFIYQSSTTPNWLNPFGHARFFNEFVQKNSQIVDGEFHIPELDQELGILYQTELQKYQAEINGLLKQHENNLVNKKQQEIKTAQKLEKVKSDFYRGIQPALRTNKILRGVTLNLLDKDIPDDATSLDIETQIANNLMKILNQGITLTEFLNETKLLESLCVDGNIGELKYNEFATLDSKLDQISSYQKVQLFLTSLLYNTSKFEEANKSDLDNERAKAEGQRIAPLTSQKYLIQSIKGFINSSDALDEIYNYVTSKIGFGYALSQCIIIQGKAGVGKTGAVVNKSIQDLSADQIWLAGPQMEQAQNLQIATGKQSRMFDHDSLMKAVITDYAQYPKTAKELEDSAHFSHTKNKFDYIDKGTLKLNTPPDNLKVLVIDEYTYFSKADLQLLNRWAKAKGVKIILAGDNHQLGHTFRIDESDRFCLFELPKLTVALREQNVHVQKNNEALDALQQVYDEVIKKYGRSARYPQTKEQVSEINSIINEQIKNTRLSYYLDENIFNGTMVNQDITDSLLEILKKSKSIALVGNSDRIKKLQQDLNISKENVFDDNDSLENIKKIQGKEFDYVIFDGNLGDPNNEDKIFNGDSVLNKLQAIYTLNTRGKQGVIIFDKNFDKYFNGLSNIKEFNTAQAKGLADIVNEFIDFEEERLNKINFNSDYHDLSEYHTSIQTTEETPKTPEQTIAEEITVEEKQLQEQNTPEQIEKQLESFDTEHQSTEEELEQPSVTKQENNSKIADQTVISYFQPISRGYKRTQNDKGEIIYEKMDGDYSTQELGIVANVLGFYGNLNEEQLQQCVNEQEKILRSLITYITMPSTNSENQVKKDWMKYCNILKALKDGDAYITLESSEYSDDFKYLGLGTVSDSEKSMKIYNGKVYRYVLHFKGNIQKTSLFGKDASITLSFAANPETWRKKKQGIDDEIKELKKTLSEDDQLILQKKAESQAIADEIANYEKILTKTSDDGSITVEFDGAFTKLREITEDIQTDRGPKTVPRKRRFGTLVVDQEDGGKIVDSGWLNREGKYKSVSDVYILGSDLDSLGIKASQSGKCCVFVSELAIPQNQLLNLYLEEKRNKSGKCIVRMFILDNAGINFTTLLNPNYSELYKTQTLTKDGKNKIFSLPFKSEVTGYRMLTSMWNWRADLQQFINLYNQNFEGTSKEDIDRVAELKYNNQEIPEELKALSDKIDTFNSKICADAKLHTFRLGGSKQHVQQITGFANIEDYFQHKETISEAVKEHGIFGLYLNYDKAVRYKTYIDEIFRTFSGEQIDINEINVYNSKGELKTFSQEENIDGHRLHSLSSKKSSSDQRAPGNSLTNFLDNRVDCNTITVNDGTTEISFSKVGDASFLSQFPSVFTHMCKVLWAINRNSDNPELNLDLGKLTFDSENGDKVELDMTRLKHLVFENAIPSRPEDFGTDKKAKPFEFMDMINYMFHGTLADVSTHSLEWKDGKIVGGRDNYQKITGVMYPNGIFVDPRIDQNTAIKSNEDSDENMFFNTHINPMFLLTGVTSDLVLRFNIRFDENKTPDKNITFQQNGDTIVYNSNSDITIDEILSKYNIKVEGDTYYINDLAYKLIEESNNSYTFQRDIKTGNVQKKLFNISDDVLNESTLNMQTSLADEYTVEDFLRSELGDEIIPTLTLITPADGNENLNVKVVHVLKDGIPIKVLKLERNKETDIINISLIDPEISEPSVSGETSANEPDIDEITNYYSNFQLSDLAAYISKFKEYFMERGFLESDFDENNSDVDDFSIDAQKYFAENCKL